MNNTIQTILVITTVTFALGFLVKKFLWSPKTFKSLTKGQSKKRNSKSCGSDNCGCH